MRYVDLLRLKEEKYKYFTLEESLKVVKSGGLNLQYVKHQTPEICLAAVRQNGHALVYVWNQTEEICLEAYKNEPESSVRYIRIDIKDEKLRKIKEKYYKYHTQEESLRAVRDGWTLRFVKHQTDEICMKAVKKSGSALLYVINQTEEICLEAYKRDPGSIIFVRDSLEEYRKRRLNLIENAIT